MSDSFKTGAAAPGYHRTMTRRELLAAAAGAAICPIAEGYQSMEQRVSIVTLGVKDLGRARRFYVDLVGCLRALLT
jgi:hypothetical protein